MVVATKRARQIPSRKTLPPNRARRRSSKGAGRRSFLQRAVLTVAAGVVLSSGCASRLARLEDKVVREIARTAVKNASGGNQAALTSEMKELVADKIAKEAIEILMSESGKPDLNINVEDLKRAIIKEIASQSIDRFWGRDETKTRRQRPEPASAKTAGGKGRQWPQLLGWDPASPISKARIDLINGVATKTGLSPEEILVSILSNGFSESHLKVRKMRLKGARGVKRRMIENDVRALTELLKIRKRNPVLVNGTVNSVNFRFFAKGKLQQIIKKRSRRTVTKKPQNAIADKN